MAANVNRPTDPKQKEQVCDTVPGLGLGEVEVEVAHAIDIGYQPEAPAVRDLPR